MEVKPYVHNVKYYETDQMAIVHHSNYIRWYEEARIYWMAQVGIDYAEMERRGIIIPVIGVTSEYKTMTHFGEDVKIQLHLYYYNGVRMKCSYEVYDVASGVLRNTGTSDHCFIDRENNIINLRKVAPDLHQILKSVKEQPAK